MSFVQQLQVTAQAPMVNVPATGASLLTVVAAWLEQIHGPAATVGVVLGSVWVGLQIFLAVKREWFPKKGK